MTTDKISDLITVPELRKVFLILAFGLIANVVAYNGLGYNSINFHGNELLNYFFLALTDLPGLVLGWYMVERRPGRRWTNAFMLTLCGVALCIPATLPSTATIAVFVLTLLGKFGTAASFTIIYLQVVAVVT